MLCHNYYDFDIINDYQTRVMVHSLDTIPWKINQYGNLIEIILIDDERNTLPNMFNGMPRKRMNNWKIKIINNVVVCANIEEKGSLFRIKRTSNKKYFKLIDSETNLYLMQNTENKSKRDIYSYYMELTSEESKASEFKFELY